MYKILNLIKSNIKTFDVRQKLFFHKLQWRLLKKPTLRQNNSLPNGKEFQTIDFIEDKLLTFVESFPQHLFF
jgi:hypothetical protein